MRHFREHTLAPVHHTSIKMASVVEITPKFGVMPEKKGPSPAAVCGYAVVGALVGCAATIGVAYPTLKSKWDKDDAPAVDKNPCAGKKPGKGAGFDNFQCIQSSVTMAVEQAGGNVSLGYDQGTHMKQGQTTLNTPVTTTLAEAGMCPVNVHWHLGAEHTSVDEYSVELSADANNGPSTAKYDPRLPAGRKLLAASGGTTYLGGRCNKYATLTADQKKDYDWKYCKNMVVGETYEVHWPHSEMGACNTKWQYQYPFYDGVLCRLGEEAYPGKGKFGLGTVGGVADPLSLPGQIGVQGQVFVVVNDEDYYYPDMLRGMIITDANAIGTNGIMGKEVTAYTGSTTGTSRDNTICSAYGPITWHVDRKCHLISASSFDKMCKDMLEQGDDMSNDIYPHGAREVVSDALSANNRDDLGPNGATVVGTGSASTANVYNDRQ
jgi:hypothetical protein